MSERNDPNARWPHPADCLCGNCLVRPGSLEGPSRGPRTLIVLEFEGESAQAVRDLVEGTDLGLLLRDALGEFVSMREPASDYVARRYEGQSESFMRSKLLEVEKRKKLVELLKRGDLQVLLGDGERS